MGGVQGRVQLRVCCSLSLACRWRLQVAPGDYTRQML